MAQRLVSEEDSLRSGPAEIARFIFSAGFSTADAVSAVSGRGVGMDVALVNVTKLGGTIDIDTRPGAGTSFRLDMPLSAAIQPMLLVETAVQATPCGPREALQSVNGQPAVLFHGQFLPVYDLAELLRLPGGGAADAHVPLVVCEWQGQRIGLAVRRILRRHEMLIRETHPRVARLPGIGGVTTLGFDRIVLVADPDGIVDLARRPRRGACARPKTAFPPGRSRREPLPSRARGRAALPPALGLGRPHRPALAARGRAEPRPRRAPPRPGPGGRRPGADRLRRSSSSSTRWTGSSSPSRATSPICPAR